MRFLRPASLVMRPPTAADVRFVAEHMREADRREVKRCSGEGHEWCLEHSVRESDACCAVEIAGSVAVIGGAVRRNLVRSTGTIWALSTDVADRHPVDYVRATPFALGIVCRALRDVRTFENWVDADYAAAVRWVKWFGGVFRAGDEVRMPGGVRFLRFTLANPYYRED